LFGKILPSQLMKQQKTPKLVKKETVKKATFFDGFIISQFLLFLNRLRPSLKSSFLDALESLVSNLVAICKELNKPSILKF